MSLDAILTKLQTLHASVTGIARAYKLPPDNLNTTDIPCVVTFVDTGDYSTYSQNGGRTDHHLIVRVYGQPVGQEDSAAARLAELVPFELRMRNLYYAHTTLDNTDYVVDADPESYAFVISPYMAVPWTALEVRLAVTEKQDGLTISG